MTLNEWRSRRKRRELVLLVLVHGTVACLVLWLVVSAGRVLLSMGAG